MTAWIFGPMLPAAKCLPSARYCLASASVRWSIQRCCGVPKSSATFSTAVEMMNRPAPSSTASRADARSLSMTAATPCRLPASSAATGIPPPPTAMITVPASSSRLMARSSTMRSGWGEATTRRQPRPASSMMSQPSARRRSACSASMNEPIGFLCVSRARAPAAPPAAARVLEDAPACGAAPVSLLGIHERADRLARFRERRVVRGHLGLADQRDRVGVDPVAPELVAQILLQLVADGALGVRPAHVERQFVQLMGCQLGPPEDEADLRAVAMGDRDAPAILDHGDDVAAGFTGGNVLVPDRLGGPVLDQGVAADRDDCHALVHVGQPPASSSSAP